eukprot:SAG11_NODE_6255_length_1351_cov_2.023962_1_plen_129_part_00
MRLHCHFFVAPLWLLQVYAAALLVPFEVLDDILLWATLLGALLCGCSARGVEMWPVSHMGLFPYGATRLREIKLGFGSSLRLAASAERLLPTDGRRALFGQDGAALDLCGWWLHASAPYSRGRFEGYE